MSDLGVTFTDQLISELKKEKIETGNLRNEVMKFLESQFNENKHEFIFSNTSQTSNYINVWGKWLWKNYNIS